MDPMALPWRAHWREFVAVVAMTAVGLGIGAGVYWSTAPESAPITPITARVIGFSGAGTETKLDLAGGAKMIVDFRLADGRRWSRQIDAGAASQCRAGQVVELGIVTRRNGRDRIVVPVDPCHR